VAAAGVLLGVSERTVLLINSAEDPAEWKRRLNLRGRVLTLPAAAEGAGELRFVGAACAAGAARLVGVIPETTLEQALREELADLPEGVLAENLRRAREAWETLAPHHGCVEPAADGPPLGRPDWIDLPLESARISAPHVHAAATSVQVRTGLWRTMRPVIDHEHCNRCTWVCTTFCPDGAIHVDAEGAPRIDYDHCKGCLICVAVCPPHAIAAVPEARAAAQDSAKEAP
jgi:pyruvate ferredoxin oxidoreductase gamma subunit